MSVQDGPEYAAADLDQLANIHGTTTLMSRDFAYDAFLRMESK